MVACWRSVPVPPRSVAARCWSTVSRPGVIDLGELYGALAAQLPELNLEGAVVQGQQLLLAQRGNGQGGVNALIGLDLSRVLDGLHQERAIGQCAVCCAAGRAGRLAGRATEPHRSVPWTCRGACCFPAAAEDTTSSYHDGACTGSVIGCLDAGRVSRQWPLAGQTKIEGLAMLADGSLRLVNDPDDRQQRSRLFRPRPTAVLTASRPVARHACRSGVRECSGCHLAAPAPGCWPVCRRRRCG